MPPQADVRPGSGSCACLHLSAPACFAPRALLQGENHLGPPGDGEALSTLLLFLVGPDYAQVRRHRVLALQRSAWCVTRGWVGQFCAPPCRNPVPEPVSCSETVLWVAFGHACILSLVHTIAGGLIINSTGEVSSWSWSLSSEVRVALWIPSSRHVELASAERPSPLRHWAG